MYLKETECEGVDRLQLVGSGHSSMVAFCEYSNEPLCSMKARNFFTS
jgi:hypothetical protein